MSTALVAAYEAEYDSDFTDRLLFGEKVCATCGVALPANREHFTWSAKRGRGNWKRSCKRCLAAKGRRKYREAP
jgi:hypothetical protein